MKNLIYGVLFLASTGIGISSCQKVEKLKKEKNSSSINKTNLKNNKDLVFEYYLDKKQVSKSKVDFNDESLYISITKGEKDETIIVEAFSSREDYILYGKKHNLKFKELLSFEDEMKNYVKKNDIINLFEKTGKIPEWYTAFEAKTYEKHFGVSSQQKSLATVLHKNFYGGPDRVIGVLTPYLWGGWNNQVSAFTPIGVYGFTSLYDKSFYRKRMVTIWGWGMQRVLLYWGSLYNANDRTTSVITG